MSNYEFEFFKKNQPVYVVNLGPDYVDQKFRAEVAGLANNPFYTNGPYTYIVKMIDKIPTLYEYDYDYIVITGACLEKIIKEN